MIYPTGEGPLRPVGCRYYINRGKTWREAVGVLRCWHDRQDAILWLSHDVWARQVNALSMPPQPRWRIVSGGRTWEGVTSMVTVRRDGDVMVRARAA